MKSRGSIAAAGLAGVLVACAGICRGAESAGGLSEVNLYTYYLDMDSDRKMNKYWGNGFFPPGPGKGEAAGAHRVIPPRNQWQCWEFMIQANSHQADGRQAMWVDGRRVGEFTGIRWRKDRDLKVNCLWLQHYGYDDGDPTRQFWKEKQSVWFDDVVVATRYIGPREKNQTDRQE